MVGQKSETYLFGTPMMLVLIWSGQVVAGSLRKGA